MFALTACVLLAIRLTVHCGVAAAALPCSVLSRPWAVVRGQQRRLNSATISAAPLSIAALTALTLTLALGALALVLARLVSAT